MVLILLTVLQALRMTLLARRDLVIENLALRQQLAVLARGSRKRRARMSGRIDFSGLPLDECGRVGPRSWWREA